MAMAGRRTRAESRARYYIREEARKRGWNVAHVSAGGQFLEENEILAYFPDIGLGLDKPDFLACLGGEPCMVLEAKNEDGKISAAIEDAIGYADQINSTGRYNIRLAVGAAGEEDTGFTVVVCFQSGGKWIPLTSYGQEVTTIPDVREVEAALAAGDGTTTVSIPASSEFIDAAVELSILLRLAKVEAPLRPKVIGAIVVAIYQGEIDPSPRRALESINTLVAAAINSATDITSAKKKKLLDALRLSGADFDRLAPYIRRAVAVLRRLNVRSVLHTDTDFLGMFYEAFLRYGYDNNALGIVFTPRHITRFCVDLVGASPNARVIDIACGTGGFLVAAYDAMMGAARSAEAVRKVKSSIWGFDTNPTVWALANLNMFFRGDGKSNINLGSCLDRKNRAQVSRNFTRAFLNPPFSQEEEPEILFVSAAMDSLEPEGVLAAVVYAGVFADQDHAKWRTEFLRRHTLLGMISLPEELFYPTSAPTTILLAKAHVPQKNTGKVLMARVWNDGFEKLKNRRVVRDGSQLEEVQNLFHNFLAGRRVSSDIVTVVKGASLNSGAEWSPQQWLPQPEPSETELQIAQEIVLRSIYQAVAQFPQLSEEVLEDFTSAWSAYPDLAVGQRLALTEFFEVQNGRSIGEKNYADGGIPYISSGDQSNSITRLISPIHDETFVDGAITVTAFGTASVQPWPFMGRGNGGSSVRVLIPRFNATFRELVWFAAQINLQNWRFFYARMAIKSRLERLEVESPPARLPDAGAKVSSNVRRFAADLDNYSRSAA
jgi:type I restriction enzyme M protein